MIGACVGWPQNAVEVDLGCQAAQQWSMTEMHRALALRAEHDRRTNGPLVRRIRVALEVALVLLLLEILAWLFSIGGIFD